MCKNYYGNQRTRHRAKMLKTNQIWEYTWIVTGGENEHRVTLENRTWQCDCKGQDSAVDGMCSHCLAVWLVIHGDFRK